jgi:hypothetical protein
MPEFRKLSFALAAVTLFAGLASAQVTGGTGTGSLTCLAQGAATPQLRAEGYTELAGDIVITCTGGSALAVGTAIPTANIVLFLSTTVTSRLLVTNGVTASEALLLIDEPGSGLPGYGPSLPQIPCTNPNLGASAGGCTEYVGATGVPVTTLGGTSPGANVFQGISSGQQITFFGIPVLPPVTSGSERIFRITNVRVNANAVAAGVSGPGSVTAQISTNGSSSLAISNPTQTVGFVQQGLSSTGTRLSSTTNPSSSSSGASLAQCSSLSVTSTSSTSGALGLLTFQENFGTAFKIRQTSTVQNIPGYLYNSESGFIFPGFAGSLSATGGTTIAGLADYGTRLKAVFTNVPTSVSLYVSTRDITNAFNILPASGYTGPQAQLVLSETASDGANGAGPALSTQTTVFGFGSSVANSTVPLAPVAISAAGTGTAVWEVTATNPGAIDTINFGVYASYSAAPASNSPTPGTFSVTMSFAPTPSSGLFTSTTGPAASSTLPIPRFSDSLDITKPVASIGLCTTAMLFPYVINVNGFDTGMAIANTTTDPFGTTAQAGTCSLYFYGSSAPTTEPFVTPTVATGTVYANLASTLAPGFSGYMIANCNFQYAHGFAFISDVGARNLAMGYLALVFYNSSVLGRSGIGSGEQLNN